MARPAPEPRAVDTFSRQRSPAARGRQRLPPRRATPPQLPYLFHTRLFFPLPPPPSLRPCLESPPPLSLAWGSGPVAQPPPLLVQLRPALLLPLRLPAAQLHYSALLLLALRDRTLAAGPPLPPWPHHSASPPRSTSSTCSAAVGFAGSLHHIILHSYCARSRTLLAAPTFCTFFFFFPRVGRGGAWASRLGCICWRCCGAAGSPSSFAAPRAPLFHLPLAL